MLSAFSCICTPACKNILEVFRVLKFVFCTNGHFQFADLELKIIWGILDLFVFTGRVLAVAVMACNSIFRSYTYMHSFDSLCCRFSRF